MEMIEKARIFATAAHGATGQKRKYINTPYIEHPASVVEILANDGWAKDSFRWRTIATAAWLHDVAEDTEISIGDIEIEFGDIIAHIVSDLSDMQTPEDGTRAERKERAAQKLAKSHPWTQTIKYADLIHNTSSIVEHDKRFAKTYLKEKRRLLDLMDAGSESLRAKAYRVLNAAEKQLEAGQ
jgi:(p)ppGpp synthase/HD superfamily hydrolase